ncbi:MAG: phage tail protein [Candidatus Ventricola sp.]
MIEFDIAQLFPRFLLEDRNGLALARAIERALTRMDETVQAGLDVLKDVEKMPEWRLDEMAWELDCLYDAGADTDTKRRWIRDATPLQAATGTPRAIAAYLEGTFDRTEVVEAFASGGEPFHFRVLLEGEWTRQKARFAQMAIGRAKNVRSVLDGVNPSSRCLVRVDARETEAFPFPYPMAAAPDMGGPYCGEDGV